MKLRPVVAAAALALPLLSAPGASAAPPSYQAIDPGNGNPAEYAEEVPIQLVFLGYEPGQVDTEALLAELPERYAPVVRSRQWYGVTEELGIDYTYDVSTTFTDAAYEDAFFGRLTELSVPESSVDGRERTLYQQAYNDQQSNVLEVGTNHFIDAPSVEQWLYENPPAGVDPSRDTIVFTNWWGRDDFRFHTYVKFGEPDPDTGYDFGRQRQSRKIIAWGGTPASDEETGFGAESRLWFYDLSAGPESWTDNWNVDSPDLNGDGVEEYRMPPIWEYAENGYRDPGQLSSDLGLVTRYVAINLLFTSSPLYPPYITPNRQPLSVNLDSNTYEGWKGTDASTAYLTPSLVRDEVGELEPIAYSTDQQDLAFKQKAKNCYTLWLHNNACYPRRPYPGGANLFLYNALTQDTWRDGGGQYEAGLFNYATQENRAAGFLGFADDNWIDGTQSGVFSFVNPGVVAAGYGLSTTQIHEFGHHTALSHPHDGYDSETDVDYGPGGRFYFAWSGDEQNSMMSYIDLNWDFSQFDLDNNARFKAAAFYRSVNGIAAAVQDSPDADAGAADLEAADDDLVASQNAFSAHEYEAAYSRARSAYQHALDAADAAGVTVDASMTGWRVREPTRGNGNANRYAYIDRYGPDTHRGRP